jgi:hypothetical protein
MRIAEASRRTVMTAGAVSLFVLLPSLAHAKVPIPINTGDEIFAVAPLPAPLTEGNPQLAAWKLGYMCDRFGILWADAWTWNCKMVAYDGNNTYSDLPEGIRAKLESEYPMSKAQRGVWNHYGIVVIAGGLIGLGVLKASS